MSKMKIEVKMTNKNKITGMRKLPDKKGKCRNCYYYISKRFKSFQQKRRIRMRIRFRLSVLQKLF